MSCRALTSTFVITVAAALACSPKGERQLDSGQIDTTTATADSSISAAETQDNPAKRTEQMQAVLDQLAALHPKPITELSAAEARKQPSPADAVKALLKKQGKST